MGTWRYRSARVRFHGWRQYGTDPGVNRSKAADLLIAGGQLFTGEIILTKKGCSRCNLFWNIIYAVKEIQSVFTIQGLPSYPPEAAQ